MVGRIVLNLWPDDGWQRGTVARLCRSPTLSFEFDWSRATVARHTYSSRHWAGRSTDIRIESSAAYNLKCTFMARITSERRNVSYPAAWILPLRPTVFSAGNT